MDKKFTDKDKTNWIDWIEFHGPNEAMFRIISKHKDELVPFVGCGLSVFAGYPSWGNMLRKIVNLAGRTFTEDEIKKIFEFIEKHKFYDAGDILREKISNVVLEEWLSEIFDEEKISRFINSQDGMDRLIEEAVWFVPELSKNKRLCLTTNFDMVLEHVFHAAKVINSVSMIPESHQDIPVALSRGQTVLIKLHGSIDSRSFNMVLSNKDANDHYYTKNSFLVICLESNMLEHRLIFLGTALDEDFTVETLIKLRQKNFTPHFAILPLKSNENIQERIEKLDYMKVIPLFYPENDHTWVPIILRWLVEGYKPYEGILQGDIKRFESSPHYKFLKNSKRAPFQDYNGDLEMIMRFLDLQRRFLWWEICGAGDFGKTRWAHEIKESAEARGWDVFLFDADDYHNRYPFEEFTMERNMLLIFDDADLYYNSRIGTEESDGLREDYISYNNFLTSIQNLVAKSNQDKKLRLIFMFSDEKGSELPEDKLPADKENRSPGNWWSSLSDKYHIFTNRFPPNTLKLSWPRHSIELFIRNFINQYYVDHTNKDVDMVVVTILDKIYQKKETPTPLLCMIYTDVYFFSRDLSEYIKQLMDYLQNSGKKRYLGQTNINALIKEHEDNFLFLNKRGKSMMLDMGTVTLQNKAGYQNSAKQID